MKNRNILLISLVLLALSCSKKQQIIHPFNPALEQVVTELMDSLKNENIENKILSIQFFCSRDTFLGCDFRIFLSDWYASSSIDGIVNFDGIPVAIYNIKYDYNKLINNESIINYKDTVVGFRNVYIWETSEKDIYIPQFCFKSNGDRTVSLIHTRRSFGQYPYAEMIREVNCPGCVKFFVTDSIEDLK